MSRRAPNGLMGQPNDSKECHRQSPFSLVYVPTARYGLLTEALNASELPHALDTLDELREASKLRIAAYQQTISSSFNKNIRVRTFQEGDLVLRRVFQNTRDREAGKLAPNWEGTYLVSKNVGQGAYRLATLEGGEIRNSWNAVHLKRYWC